MNLLVLVCCASTGQLAKISAGNGLSCVRLRYIRLLLDTLNMTVLPSSTRRRGMPFHNHFLVTLYTSAASHSRYGIVWSLGVNCHISLAFLPTRPQGSCIRVDGLSRERVTSQAQQHARVFSKISKKFRAELKAYCSTA